MRSHIIKALTRRAKDKGLGFRDWRTGAHMLEMGWRIRAVVTASTRGRRVAISKASGRMESCRAGACTNTKTGGSTKDL